MNNKDMPAMPLTGDAYTDFSEAANNKEASYNPECQGLTKREHFAGLAMQSILDRYNPWEDGDFDSSNYEFAAKNCVGMADALLKALEE